MYHSAKVCFKQQSSQYPDESKQVVHSQVDLKVIALIRVKL